MRRNKTNAKVTCVDGIIFSSEMESKMYLQLKQLKETGMIRDFSLQPVFNIIEPFMYMGKKEQGNKYTADYLITHTNGSQEVIEIKGMIARDFPLRLKLFKKNNPHLKITLLKEVNQCDIPYQSFFKGFIELHIHNKLVAQRKRAKKNGAAKKVKQSEKGSIKG